MTRARDWAAKVDRAATDPERIERRKKLASALVVPRTTSLHDAATEFGIDLDELRREGHS